MNAFFNAALLSFVIEHTLEQLDVDFCELRFAKLLLDSVVNSTKHHKFYKRIFRIEHIDRRFVISGIFVRCIGVNNL